MGTVRDVSDTSPGDLAVAFRSFPRRIEQALAALDDPGTRTGAESHARAAHEGIASAATLLGVPAGDPAGTAAAVADKIAGVHPDAWDDVTLAGLRRIALAVGAEVRAVSDLAR